MRRSIPLLMSLLLVLASAGPATAVKPIRGCGNEGFEPMLYDEFREMLINMGVPEEFLGAEHRGLWVSIDHNGDDILCVKGRTETPGHLAHGQFNVVDNTSNH